MNAQHTAAALAAATPPETHSDCTQPEPPPRAPICEKASPQQRKGLEMIGKKWASLRSTRGQPNSIRLRFLRAWGMPDELAAEDTETVARAFIAHVSTTFHVTFES